MTHEPAQAGILVAPWLMLGGLVVYLANRHLVRPQLRKLAESTWSPFQSTDVRDICAHLTVREKKQITSDAARRGREIFWHYALPLGAIACSFKYSIHV